MKAFAIFVVIFAVIVFFGTDLYAHIRTQDKVLHITGKESVTVNDGNNGSKHEYRVYALEDTYVIKDTLLHTRFDSSRLYGRLPVPVGAGDGQHAVTMTCTVTGWRIPVFSKFQNILSCRRQPQSS